MIIWVLAVLNNRAVSDYIYSSHIIPSLMCFVYAVQGDWNSNSTQQLRKSKTEVLAASLMIHKKFVLSEKIQLHIMFSFCIKLKFLLNSCDKTKTLWGTTHEEWENQLITKAYVGFLWDYTDFIFWIIFILVCAYI